MYDLKFVFGDVDEGSGLIDHQSLPIHGGLRSTNGSTWAPVCTLMYDTRRRWRRKSADGSYKSILAPHIGKPTKI